MIVITQESDLVDARLYEGIRRRNLYLLVLRRYHRYVPYYCLML